MMAYGKVEENFYSRSEVRGLSFFGKSVLIYLLVNHHRNFIGLYFLPHSYAIEDLDISLQQYKDALNEIAEAGLIFYDEKEKTIFVAINLEHNPLNSEKQIKGAINLIKEIRSVRLLQEFEKRNPIDTLSIAIRNRIDTLSIPYGKGMQGVPIEEEVKEDIKEKEKLKETSSSSQEKTVAEKENIKYYTNISKYEIDVETYKLSRARVLTSAGVDKHKAQVQAKAEADRLFVLEEGR